MGSLYVTFAHLYSARRLLNTSIPDLLPAVTSIIAVCIRNKSTRLVSVGGVVLPTVHPSTHWLLDFRGLGLGSE